MQELEEVDESEDVKGCCVMFATIRKSSDAILPSHEHNIPLFHHSWMGAKGSQDQIHEVLRGFLEPLDMISPVYYRIFQVSIDLRHPNRLVVALQIYQVNSSEASADHL